MHRQIITKNPHLKTFKTILILFVLSLTLGLHSITLASASQPVQQEQFNSVGTIPPRPVFTCEDTIRIMPVGDSITKGRYSGDIDPSFDALRKGYRAHLWWALVNNGYNVEFVGDEMDGWDLVPPIDPDHEGHGGWSAAQIESNIYNFLNSNPTDIILLHIGTNGDQSQDHVNDVEDILDEIDRWEADNTQHITVILARIINRQGGGHTATTNFNIAVAAMASARTSDDIIIVDLENGAGLDYNTDMVDDKHPNEAGYTKMALGSPPTYNESWYAKLGQLLPACPSITCPDGMAAYWRLDETTGNIFQDSYNGNPASCITDDCPLPAAGILNGGQAFSRVDTTKASVPADAIFNWGKDDSFTIEYWMKGIEGVSCFGNSTDHNEVIVGRQGTVGNNLHFWTGCQAQGVAVGGKAAWQLRDINNLGDKIIGTSNIIDNDWHHIVAMRNASTDWNYLYVDGVQEGSMFFDYANGFASAADALNLGWLNSGAGYHFTGTLDEVAIYNRVLTEDEIEAHYNGGAGAPYCTAASIAPSITSTPPLKGTLSALYTYDVNATGYPAPTFSLEYAPTGMTIDPVTGVINWTPDAIGNYEVIVLATNTEGLDDQVYTILVTAPPVCPAGMMHYWNLDEGAGATTFVDTLGGADAGCTGALCPSAAAGQVDGSQDFNGASDGTSGKKISTAEMDDTPSDGITVMAWIKPETLSGGDKGIVVKGGVFLLELESDKDWSVNFTAYTPDGLAEHESTDCQVPVGQWSYIAGTYDGTASKTYLNGIKCAGELAKTSVISHSTQPYEIGYSTYASNRWFDGNIDEVAVFNTTLTESEILALYEKGAMGTPYCSMAPSQPLIISTAILTGQIGSPYQYDVEAIGSPNPTYTLTLAPVGMTIDLVMGVINWTPTALGDHNVTVRATNSEGFDEQSFVINVITAPVCPLDMTGYWKLDEITAGTYEDSYGDNDGLCSSGDCPTPVAGIVDGAQAFSRLNETKINIPQNAIFDWGKDDSFTIEYWMKGIPGVTCLGNTTDDNEVIVGRDDSSSQLHIWTGCQAEDIPVGGRAAFRLMDINYNGDKIVGTSDITDGEWHHIVAVRDNTQDKNFLYVDGVKEGEYAHDYTAGFGSATAPLNIGWLNSSQGFHFTGSVDEVAIYNRALSLSEIADHYNSGLGKDYCTLPPTDINLSNQEITENQPVGTLVGILSTVDPDQVDDHVYTLAPGVMDNDFFSISSDQLLSNAVFDFDIKDTYTIQIRSTDKDGLFVDKVFTISILDEKDLGFNIYLPLFNN